MAGHDVEGVLGSDPSAAGEETPQRNLRCNSLTVADDGVREGASKREEVYNG